MSSVNEEEALRELMKGSMRDEEIGATFVDPPHRLNKNQALIGLIMVALLFMITIIPQQRNPTGYVVSELDEQQTIPEQTPSPETTTETQTTNQTNQTAHPTEAPLSEETGEELTQEPAEINKPVKWHKKVKVAQDEIIEVPKESMNIKVKKREPTGETDITERVTIEKEAKKTKNLLTGSTIQEQESTITAITVPEAGDMEVEYETEAPQVYEEQITPYRKRVTVSSTFPYVNVSVYTSITESPADAIKMYWLVDGSRVEVNDAVFKDTNTNGLTDRIEWITSHLSNQTYEIEIDILNVQSHPTQGGNWTVDFTTHGSADLRIYASSGTTWTDVDEGGYDLQFLEVKCGSQQIATTFVKESPTCETDTCYVFVANYSCDQTASEISKVLTPGQHTLRFLFGGQEAFAYNQAMATLVPNKVAHPAVSGALTENTFTVSTSTELTLQCYGEVNKTDQGQCLENEGTASLDAYFRANFTLPVYSSLNFVSLKSRAAKPGTTGADNLTIAIYNWTSKAWVTENISINPATNLNITLTYNITSAGEKTNYVDANRKILFMSRTSGGGTEDIRQDYMEAVVSYETPDTVRPLWFNPQKNETSVTQNKYVNFTSRWTDDVGLHGFIFAINQSLNFVNSTYRTFTTVANNASNVTQITAATGTNVSWRFYANDTSGNWNETEIQTFLVTSGPGLLNITLITPTGTNSQVANQTFTLQANVTCLGDTGGICGTVNGTVRYNQSSVNPNTAITGNNVFATPFYAVQRNPISCGLLSVGDLACNVTWTINATGAVSSSYRLDVNFSSNLTDTGSNLTANTTINIIAQTLSITISDSLANIQFGSSLTPGNNNTAAINNTDNAYNVTCSNAGANCNITILAGDEMRSGINVINISNISWNRFNNQDTEINLTRSLQIINNTLPDGKAQLLYFWLDIPGGIPAGTYTSNFTIEGTAS